MKDAMKGSIERSIKENGLTGFEGAQVFEAIGNVEGSPGAQVDLQREILGGAGSRFTPQAVRVLVAALAGLQLEAEGVGDPWRAPGVGEIGPGGQAAASEAEGVIAEGEREEALRRADIAEKRGDKILAAALRGAVRDLGDAAAISKASEAPLSTGDERAAQLARADQLEKAGDKALAATLRQAVAEVV